MSILLKPSHIHQTIVRATHIRWNQEYDSWSKSSDNNKIAIALDAVWSTLDIPIGKYVLDSISIYTCSHHTNAVSAIKGRYWIINWRSNSLTKNKSGNHVRIIDQFLINHTVNAPYFLAKFAYKTACMAKEVTQSTIRQMKTLFIFFAKYEHKNQGEFQCSQV